MWCVCNFLVIILWFWYGVVIEGLLLGEFVSRIYVSIIGVGLGGLVLVQVLKCGGVVFDVFEVDKMFNLWLQGYCIWIDVEG